MERKEILDGLTEVFKEVFDVDQLELEEDTVADDIEEWDSLSHIQLMVAVERKFGVKFTSREMKELADVGEMISCIRSKMK